MIIITHIPKTGGTSFRDYLVKALSGCVHADYGQPLSLAPWWRCLLGRAFTAQRLPWGTRCIIGHFRATRYDAWYPQARHGVWLRDPVQRYLSTYYHHLRTPIHRVHREFRGPRPTLAEFIQQSRWHNRQTLLLDGKPLDAFAFVGLTEQFEMGLQLFARIFELPPPTAVPRHNTNPHRQEHGYSVDPDLEQLILANNARDLELYRQGQARFKELCEQYGLLPRAAAA